MFFVTVADPQKISSKIRSGPINIQNRNWNSYRSLLDTYTCFIWLPIKIVTIPFVAVKLVKALLKKEVILYIILEVIFSNYGELLQRLPSIHYLSIPSIHYLSIVSSWIIIKTRCFLQVSFSMHTHLSSCIFSW